MQYWLTNCYILLSLCTYVPSQVLRWLAPVDKIYSVVKCSSISLVKFLEGYYSPSLQVIPRQRARSWGGVGQLERWWVGGGRIWPGPGLETGTSRVCIGAAWVKPYPESLLPSLGCLNPDQSDCTAQGPCRVGHPWHIQSRALSGEWTV